MLYMRTVERYGKEYIGVYKGALDDPDSVSGKLYTIKSDDLSKATALAEKLTNFGRAEIEFVEDVFVIAEEPKKSFTSANVRKLNKMAKAISGRNKERFEKAEAKRLHQGILLDA